MEKLRTSSLGVLLAFAGCLSWSFASTNYCALNPEHTMCIYQGIGPDCKNAAGGGVSVLERREILQTHNKFRSLVAGGHEKRGKPGPQPSAANMLKMQWDTELAKVAQRWADQCKFQHDKSREDKRWRVGQNIFWKYQYPRHTVNWTEAITSWYEEVTLFDANTVSAFVFKSEIAHYTQMVWHNSYAVGCGRRDYGHNKIYVCNYGPAGNWRGEAMYAVGKGCSQCPKGYTCEKNLCENATWSDSVYVKNNDEPDLFTPWEIQEDNGDENLVSPPEEPILSGNDIFFDPEIQNGIEDIKTRLMLLIKKAVEKDRALRQNVY